MDVATLVCIVFEYRKELGKIARCAGHPVGFCSLGFAAVFSGGGGREERGRRFFLKRHVRYNRQIKRRSCNFPPCKHPRDPSEEISVFESN